MLNFKDVKKLYDLFPTTYEINKSLELVTGYNNEEFIIWLYDETKGYRIYENNGLDTRDLSEFANTNNYPNLVEDTVKLFESLKPKPLKIMLFGSNGSGKSVFAKELQNVNPELDIKAFADPIKNIVHRILGEPKNREDKEKNFRNAYITIGEMYKELFGERYWFDQVIEDGETNVIYDDARFMYEFEYACENDYITVYVKNDNHDYTNEDLKVIEKKCDYIIYTESAKEHVLEEILKHDHKN